jgi:hypothetical protein
LCGIIAIEIFRGRLLEELFLSLSVGFVILVFMYLLIKPIYRSIKDLKTLKSYMPIVLSIFMFCAVAYIALYFKFFKQPFVIEFTHTIEKLLQIMLMLLAIVAFLYVLIGFFGRRYTLRVDKFNIGGINILFDQSNEIFTKTVGTYIAAKRTLFNFDEVRDNIDQVLDAYYDSYNFIRNNLELLDSEKDVELYQLSVDIIKHLNDFLTEHQNDYRRWYDKTIDDDIIEVDGTQIIVHSTTIENVQKHYYRYDVLIPDIKDLNDFMKDIRIKEAFRISRFDWEK